MSSWIIVSSTASKTVLPWFILFFITLLIFVKSLFADEEHGRRLNLWSWKKEDGAVKYWTNWNVSKSIKILQLNPHLFIQVTDPWLGFDTAQK